GARPVLVLRARPRERRRPRPPGRRPVPPDARRRPCRAGRARGRAHVPAASDRVAAGRSRRRGRAADLARAAARRPVPGRVDDVRSRRRPRGAADGGRTAGAGPRCPTRRALGGAAARVERVALTGGSAVRIAYGEDVVVWNYGRVVPPPVLQARSLPAKVFTAPGGAVVHAYFGRAGTQVAVVAFADGNAAVVSRT